MTPKVVHVCALGVTASTLLLPQLRALKATGYEVAVCCSPDETLDCLSAEGVQVWPLRIERRAFSVSNVFSMLRLAQRLRSERVDIVHVHTPVAALWGRLAARFAGTPRVFYTAHGFYFHDRMAEPQRSIHIALERLLGRWTDHLFCQSSEDCRTALALGIGRAEHVSYLGNGVDVRRFAEVASKARTSARAELGVGDEEIVIGFVGRQVVEKGILELLEAFGTLLPSRPRLRLLLIGGTLGSDRDSAHAGTQTLLATDAIKAATILTGATKKVAEYLAAVDVFTLPSHREGMPRSIIEAMAAGLPVVATDIRGCREEVVSGTTGLIVPVGDPGRLAAALGRLIDDPDLRKRMGREGRRRAFGLYNEQFVIDRLLQIYQKQLSQRRPEACA